MKKVELLPVDQLQAGMTVAVQVVDAGGHVLLPAGAGLTDSTIAALERREIEAVSVEIECAEDPEELEKYRAKLEAHLSRLFRKAGQEPEIKALYQAIVEYRMEHRL